MIRVSIIADRFERAQGLARLLEESDCLEVVDARSLASETDWSHSGIAEVTIAIGLTHEEMRRIRGPIVALADVNDGVRFGRAVRAWLPQSAEAGDIAAAVVAASRDLLLLTPEQSRRWLRSEITGNGSTFAEALTQRELQVLRMLADGLGNKEIGASLGISEHTAKFHVSQILAKLGVTSRAEAVAIGMRRGFVPI